MNTDKLILKCTEKGKEARIVKTISRKHTFGSTMPNLKTYPKATVMNTVWGSKEIDTRSAEEGRERGIDPHKYS